MYRSLHLKLDSHCERPFYFYHGRSTAKIRVELLRCSRCHRGDVLVCGVELQVDELVAKCSSVRSSARRMSQERLNSREVVEAIGDGIKDG